MREHMEGVGGLTDTCREDDQARPVVLDELPHLVAVVLFVAVSLCFNVVRGDKERM